MKNFALKLMGLLSVALAVALLTPQRAAADEDDPPGRIARLSYTHGAVSFEPAGTDDWVSAVVNRPMTTGDKLWSDNGARAELHIGSAAIRLSDNTGFSFLNLTDNSVQLQLTAGTLNIRVRRLDEDENFEVDTPNLALSLLRPGKYRINVNEAGDATVVVVRDGEGEVTGGGSAYAIHPHEIGTFSGTDQLDSDIEPYARDEEDDFDQWSNDRDRRFDHSTSSRYVSDDVVGYEDLDDYGGWRPVPEYGNVWFPHTTVVGWAPYRYGHWVWIGPWGWTWVEDEPWGFAPFHYGRWVAVGGVWGWVPCPPRPVVVSAVYVRPVYAPALVAWVGGAHWGVGVGFGGGGGGVAWFPLGPREVYVPSYHVSQTYVTNVNISNTTVNNTYVTNVYNTTVVNKNVNVTNIKYVNQTVPGAVTATSHTAFTSAQPVGRNMIKVDQKEIASAPVSTAATPNVVPQKQAVLGAGTTVTAKPPARLESRAVVAKTAPPPPPPAFEKQESAIKANGGKPLAISETRQLQPQTQSAKGTAPVRIAPPASAATPQNAGANRAAQQQNNVQQQNVQQQNNNRPPAPNNSPQNTNATPPPNQNKPGYTPTNVNSRNYNDRPPSPRPVNPSATNPNNDSNSQLDQKHQQELENLRRKQDQERQKIEQQQYQQQQRAQQQQADERKREQLNQQHQQQLEQIERKHDQEQQQLQQKQQQERQKAQQQQQSKPAKEEKDKPKPR